MPIYAKFNFVTCSQCTEAGKLALNLVKQESLANNGAETEVVEETVETLDNVVTDEDGQRVIAIVEDQSHLSDGSATVMVVADADGETIEETGLLNLPYTDVHWTKPYIIDKQRGGGFD